MIYFGAWAFTTRETQENMAPISSRKKCPTGKKIQKVTPNKGYKRCIKINENTLRRGKRARKQTQFYQAGSGKRRMRRMRGFGRVRLV